jgi:hypothetical protein
VAARIVQPRVHGDERCRELIDGGCDDGQALLVLR